MADDRNDERPHLDRGRAPKQPLKPGEKQPAHAAPDELAQGTVDALNQFAKNLSSTETYGPSSERAKTPGNLNPVPPQDRSPSPGAAVRNPADIAAAHIAAATTAIDVHNRTEAILESDPRRERDQRVFELGQTGKLGLVPPTEAEVKAAAERSGLSEEVVDLIPKGPEEQIADDMERLDKAEERSAAGVTGTAATPLGSPRPVSGGITPQTNTPDRGSAVKPAEQEMGTPPNNLQAARDAGKTIGGAEGRAQAREESERTAAEDAGTSGNVIR